MMCNVPSRQYVLGKHCQQLCASVASPGVHGQGLPGGPGTKTKALTLPGSNWAQWPLTGPPFFHSSLKANSFPCPSSLLLYKGSDIMLSKQGWRVEHHILHENGMSYSFLKHIHHPTGKLQQSLSPTNAENLRLSLSVVTVTELCSLFLKRVMHTGLAVVLVAEPTDKLFMIYWLSWPACYTMSCAHSLLLNTVLNF